MADLLHNEQLEMKQNMKANRRNFTGKVAFVTGAGKL
jgi:hypothetical protein